MKIYYDSNSDTVALGTNLTGVSNGGMIAEDFNTYKIGIRNKNSTIYEVVDRFDRVYDSNGNSAGQTKQQVLDYLNAEFNKTSVPTSSSSNLISFTKSLSGKRVVVPKSEYNINEIVTVYVKNSNDKIVDVSDTQINGDITLDSNIDLTNYKLYIYGYQSIKIYQKQLSGFTVQILKTEHNINDILLYEVRSQSGRYIEVSDSLNTVNNTLTIQSNVDLTNCTLIIKGI